MANIRGRDVLVVGERTEVEFSAGENGVNEAGLYAFWVLRGTDEFGDWECVGRALASLPPEERCLRFESERMPSADPGNHHNGLDSREIYEILWRRLLTAREIRGASYRDVASWMAAHKYDAIYAQPNWVCRGIAIFGSVPTKIV